MALTRACVCSADSCTIAVARAALGWPEGVTPSCPVATDRVQLCFSALFGRANGKLPACAGAKDLWLQIDKRQCWWHCISACMTCDGGVRAELSILERAASSITGVVRVVKSVLYTTAPLHSCSSLHWLSSNTSLQCCATKHKLLRRIV
jgi:hypothetical protein